MPIKHFCDKNKPVTAYTKGIIIKKILLTLIFGFSCSGFMIAIYNLDLRLGSNLLERVELKTLDYRFLWRGIEEPDGQIVILGIDKRSLNNIKDPMIFWRPHFAKVIRKLAEGGAKAIGLDFVFAIPLTKKVEGKDYDKIMAMALKDADNVILTKVFIHDKEKDAYIVDEPISRLRFAASPHYAGFVNLTSDLDNHVRRQTLSIKDDKGKGHLSFGLAILAKFHDKLGKDVVEVKKNKVSLGDKIIPTNKYGEMLINFAGPNGTFPHISFYDAWKRADNESAEYFKNNFAGKIVLIGTTNILHQDFKPTPFFGSKNYTEIRSTYGVEIWANVINTMLQEKYIVRLPIWQIALIILFIGLIVSYISLQFSLTRSLITMCAFGVAYIFLCIILFKSHSVWISIVAPSFTIPLTFAVIFSYRYSVENKQRNIVKKLFQYYLHPSIVNELLKDPASVKLGGVKKELTIFFSDIEGFTSISERVDPEELVDLINVYLTEISGIIIKNEGTIDKFVGDAVMAFFGAPLDSTNHAVLACYAALDAQKHLKSLRKSFKNKGWPEINTRIGINTGDVVIGNMGGENRFDYTVLGDSVNLAARLEGANKMYSTHIMIGEQTYEIAKDEVVTRELDIIRVKGKSKPVKVYELIARKDEIDKDTIEKLKQFNNGLIAYKAHEWQKAIEYFSAVVKIAENDAPSQLYIDRCGAYLKSPPPADWDGVYEMKSK
ncbi:MAG: CHASE2 domain-containing protein [Candidatus Anammoxibacter sp.]